jgi:hypothetical protein
MQPGRASGVCIVITSLVFSSRNLKNNLDVLTLKAGLLQLLPELFLSTSYLSSPPLATGFPLALAGKIVLSGKKLPEREDPGEGPGEGPWYDPWATAAGLGLATISIIALSIIAFSILSGLKPDTPVCRDEGRKRR